MNKKVIINIMLALALYGVFVLLVVTFYDDSPEKMDWPDRQEFNRQFIGKLTLAETSIDQVFAKLGSPDITEASRIQQQHYQVTYYRTHHVKSDGRTSVEECTALLFEDGKLIAIGQTAADKYQALIKHQVKLPEV